jgi:2-oxoisovalerate dehydrogenase E2 component (dihydrolipoyl transacylase)
MNQGSRRVPSPLWSEIGITWRACVEGQVSADGRAELTSPTPGIVVSIDVHEGDTVKVGQTLCVIENEEEGGAGGGEVSPVLEDSSPAIVSEVFEPEPSTSPEVRTAEAVTEAAERSAEVSPSGPDKRGSETSQTVAGFDQVRLDGIDSDGGASVSTGVQFTGEASILPSAPSTRGSDLATHPPLQERRERDVPSETRRVILASPAVRTLAGRLGIDLGAVQGSGEKGRVTREDVERYAGSTAAASGSSTSDTSLPAAGSSSIDSRRAAGTLGTRSQWTETTRVEFGRTRKVMYRALGAQAEVPHFG